MKDNMKVTYNLIVDTESEAEKDRIEDLLISNNIEYALLLTDFYGLSVTDHLITLGTDIKDKIKIVSLDADKRPDEGN